MSAVSKTLQSSKENLESYKKGLESAQSIDFKKSLTPVLFNQLKEEAKRLMAQGMSKEEAVAVAAMNVLTDMDKMIEKNPGQFFKALNKVSGMPDAGELRRNVEENTPQPGEVGNRDPELEKRINEAQARLEGGYSLTAFVQN
jgi:hypothetical protein